VLDDALLEEYLHTFYGYGHYAAPYWLVGMEEGGRDSEEEISCRLDIWMKRGRPELDDVLAFHQESGHHRLDRWFQPNPPLQPTWKQLIRLLLCVWKRVPGTETIRAYQGGSLGRKSGETALLELLPLPSPSTGQWPYARYSRLPYLRDRVTYRDHVLGRRAAHLRARIREHAPRLVVFYSLGYRNDWQLISGASFEPASLEGFYLASNGPTLFALTKHPTATGVSNAYFEKAGALIAERLAGTPEPPQSGPPAGEDRGMAPGTRVRHPRFGPGAVVTCRPGAEGDVVEVDFDDGVRRKLLVHLARLEVD
jgi:hypothetical protein